MGTGRRLVISASRRTEILHFPDRLLSALDTHPPETVHTVVIWTKNPGLLFEHGEVLSRLKEYDQLFFHVTVTGMGSTVLEPGVPKMEEALSVLPRVVEVAGSGERVTVRFDPIVNLSGPKVPRFTNIGLFPQVARRALRAGIRRLKVSWVHPYQKVKRRLGRIGLEILDDPALKHSQAELLAGWSRELGVQLSGCCTQPFLEASACIDGALLSRLHPGGEECSLRKARDQRKLCLCTESLDIGWYLSCPGGCRYCYGQPMSYPEPSEGELQRLSEEMRKHLDLEEFG